MCECVVICVCLSPAFTFPKMFIWNSREYYLHSCTIYTVWGTMLYYRQLSIVHVHVHIIQPVSSIYGIEAKLMYDDVENSLGSDVVLRM